jgi:hypothetical protein
MKASLYPYRLISLALFSLLCCASLMPFGLAQAGDPNPAFENATEVADTREWVADSYQWLDDKTLLFFRYSNDQTQVWQHDITSGKQKKLDFLNLMETDAFEVSPDGKWVLMTEYSLVHAYKLDGSRRLEWVTKGHHEIGWMGERRHWVELIRDNKGKYYTHALVHSLDAPPGARKFLFHVTARSAVQMFLLPISIISVCSLKTAF